MEVDWKCHSRLSVRVGLEALWLKGGLKGAAPEVIGTPPLIELEDSIGLPPGPSFFGRGNKESGPAIP